MYRIAIAEDDPSQSLKLREYLHRFSVETHIDLDIEEYPDGAKLLFHYRPVYDIVLLDIEMPGVDGMEAARKIRKQDENIVIIFITNMAQYAIMGYKVKAQSYLLKPISYYGLLPELSEAIETVNKRRKERFFLLSTEGETVKNFFLF